MPKGIAKENLPSKTCVVCQRPFTWRKVWERCWDEVQTCSDRCKAERKKQRNAENRASKDDLQDGPAVHIDRLIQPPELSEPRGKGARRSPKKGQ